MRGRPFDVSAIVGTCDVSLSSGSTANVHDAPRSHWPAQRPYATLYVPCTSVEVATWIAPAASTAIVIPAEPSTRSTSPLPVDEMPPVPPAPAPPTRPPRPVVPALPPTPVVPALPPA